jgi:hypothetical protein
MLTAPPAVVVVGIAVVDVVATASRFARPTAPLFTCVSGCSGSVCGPALGLAFGLVFGLGGGLSTKNKMGLAGGLAMTFALMEA